MNSVDALLSGDRRALARLITQIENNRPEAREALAALYPHTGRAYLLGVTGAPGTGKSTLVNELAKARRRDGQTVAIVAVDPSSPFTGGAILGDRIRMRDLSGDPGVFIRSMATRGSLGGLARATADVIVALDVAGYQTIIIETVGAGQAEVDIAQLAHTTLVVEAPGLGDDVQAIKAGILEIADVLVVNKADQPGSDAAVRALRGMLNLAHPASRFPGAAAAAAHHRRPVGAGSPPPDPAAPVEPVWQVPICETVATEGKGIAELWSAIERHREHQRASGALAHWQRIRIEHQLEALIRDELYARFVSASGEQLGQAIQAILNRARDPYTVVEELLR
ncbi:MAG: methylmalonyl Co-A mutase-associated GTPase MeaB [Chloroflexi bacterium]|nr:methylmalonyl Co-A mutase-associated GTPase MeaB [Chloroflexota bacterium]